MDVRIFLGDGRRKTNLGKKIDDYRMLDAI